MKNLILLSLVIFLGLPLQANHFEKDAKVYVTAQSGLNMRATPDLEGKIVFYLEYGDEVSIVEYSTPTEYMRMDWIDGYWVKVNFEGVDGYVFDGYLSPFSVPKYGYELCNVNNDIVYPIESYFENHYGRMSIFDTLIHTESHLKIVEKLERGMRMVKTQKTGIFKLEVYLEDARLMDVYNLLLGMFTERVDRYEFKSKSIFHEDFNGNVNKVKIEMVSPVEIKMLKGGQIKITAYSYYDGC